MIQILQGDCREVLKTMKGKQTKIDAALNIKAHEIGS